MSFIFKINFILLIVFNYISVSIFSSNTIILGKNLIPIILITLWFSKIILTNTKISLRNPPKLIMLFGLFFIFNFVSIFRSHNILISISELIRLISLFVISFYIVPEYVDTKEKYISFLNIFNWTLIILLIVGIYIGFTNPIQTFTNYGNRFRFQSILNNTNALGGYMMISCISLMALIYLKGEKKYIILFLISFSTLILTDSRTSIICTLFFIGTILLFYIYNKKRFGKILIKNFIFITLLVLIFGFIFIIYKFDSTSIQEINILLSGRVDTWIKPFQQIDFKTLLIGTGSYNNYDNPHNYYINTILNWGIISTSIFVLIMITIIGEIFKNLKNFKSNLYLNKVYSINVAMFFAFLGYSFFESVFFNMGNLGSIFLWCNLGLIINNKFKEDYHINI